MAAAIIPEGIKDDKAQHVIPFVLDLLARHEAKFTSSSSPPPLIVALSAPQGAGKSLLVSLLHSALASPKPEGGHDLNTCIFSLDDFYLPHQELKKLASANPSNPLLQHRGQPSTHDILLVLSVFKSLRANKPTKIPQYDKAAFSGQGDREPEEKWEVVNTDPAKPIRVILFEGWCVGFRPLPSSTLASLHSSAAKLASDASSDYPGRLGHNSLESVTTINEALKQYDEITAQFDGLVHIDAEDPLFVYAWRKEQEHNLIKAKGSGMTDEQVKEFVDGYYPSYELYVSGLREGMFKTLKQDNKIDSAGADDRKGCQLRLIVGRDRKVKEVIKI
ncbi:hypothetical protein H2198_010322 [Neophaeococcomyces mojaviensis]|uniref:Uncharacterized protein n=1 Tax=Neophaeococcomyces mojaviensis TaxID=3383035 RepID=A0ACC2ZS14_9EURO|nr:hypothetical protein H2198_010322 [Knufia sp. JES_112]